MSREGNFATLDFSDPTIPVLLDNIFVLGRALYVELDGNQVVVSSHKTTQLLSITEELKFKTSGTVWDGELGGFFLSGGEIVVSNRGFYYGLNSLSVYPAPCSIPTALPEQLSACEGLVSIYPNPFNPSTTIGFKLPEATMVTLRVYDLTGRLVKELIAGEKVSAGLHSRMWDGRDVDGREVSSGMYLVQLQGNAFLRNKSA